MVGVIFIGLCVCCSVVTWGGSPALDSVVVAVWYRDGSHLYWFVCLLLCFILLGVIRHG